MLQHLKSVFLFFKNQLHFMWPKFNFNDYFLISSSSLIFFSSLKNKSIKLRHIHQIHFAHYPVVRKKASIKMWNLMNLKVIHCQMHLSTREAFNKHSSRKELSLLPTITSVMKKLLKIFSVKNWLIFWYFV